MMVCTQCAGKGATIGQNQIINQAGLSTETYQPDVQPAPTPCTQCNGKGYMTGASF